MRPTRALIDLAALRNNLRVLRSHLTRQQRVMAIVKADAYGHGIETMLQTLLDEGIDHLGVAVVDEARQLRSIGFDGRITLLTTPVVEEADQIVASRIEPMISDAETLDWIGATGRSAGLDIPIHLYVDTGMTRNGVWPAEAGDLALAASAIEGVHPIGMATHFARSEEIDVQATTVQIERFRSAIEAVRSVGVDLTDLHLSNSGGIINFPEAGGTLVRPGISLYGYHPLASAQHGSSLEPVMNLVSRIGSLRVVPRGTPVSYGGRWVTPTDRWIGTVPIGYGDGLMRAGTGRLEVVVGERRVPIVGTICMDEVMLDLGPAEDRPIGAIGHDVTIFGGGGGPTPTAWDVANQIGTIPYEITTAVAPRVPRVPMPDGHRQSDIPT